MNTRSAVWLGSDAGEALSRASRGALAGTGLMSSPEVALARAWDRVIEKLHALRSLQDDWDGLGSEAPPPELVDSAELILDTFRRRHPRLIPTRVLATPDASILFEWQVGQMIMEAVISTLASADFMLEEPGEHPLRWRVTLENNSQDESWGTLRRSATT